MITDFDAGKIKNVVFDLGGVVIDLKRERAVEALEALGIKNVDELLGLYRQEGPFLGLETGKVTADEFFDLMRSQAPGADDRALSEAFCQFLVDLPVERLRALRKLRDAGFRVFALSNTNPVMYNSWIANAFRREGRNINDYFDGIVASFQELICKPDPEIFRRVLTRYSLTPEETLMLDDSEANCRGAESVGMKAWQVGTDNGHDMLKYCAILLNR